LPVDHKLRGSHGDLIFFMLQIGETAPDFTLCTLTTDGPELIRLGANRGIRNTVLLFVPMAFTPVCTAELCTITKTLNDYNRLNAAVYAISGDNPYAQEAWAQKEGIRVTILSDYDHEVARAYGVAYASYDATNKLPLAGVPKRAAFVVDEAGVIRHVDIKESQLEVPEFEKIKTALAGLV
jgi:peroxiredoxin